MDHINEEKPKAIPQLDGERLKLAEHERNIFAICIEAGVTREQLLNPTFLAHVAAKLRPYSHIEVTNEDGTLYAELLVLASERTWARCHVLQWHNLSTKDVSQSQAREQVQSGPAPTVDTTRFKIAHKGQVKLWCVIDNAANPPVVVREKETSKENAQLWLSEWLKVTT